MILENSEGVHGKKVSLHNFDTYKWWLLTKLRRKEKLKNLLMILN